MSDRYQELKKNYIKGWRTWNVRSVLSHVHMPDGFAVNIAFNDSGTIGLDGGTGMIGL